VKFIIKKEIMIKNKEKIIKQKSFLDLVKLILINLQNKILITTKNKLKYEQASSIAL
jgi:hypothetical protein